MSFCRFKSVIAGSLSGLIFLSVAGGCQQTAGSNGYRSYSGFKLGPTRAAQIGLNAQQEAELQRDVTDALGGRETSAGQFDLSAKAVSQFTEAALLRDEYQRLWCAFSKYLETKADGSKVVRSYLTAAEAANADELRVELWNLHGRIQSLLDQPEIRSQFQEISLTLQNAEKESVTSSELLPELFPELYARPADDVLTDLNMIHEQALSVLGGLQARSTGSTQSYLPGSTQSYVPEEPVPPVKQPVMPPAEPPVVEAPAGLPPAAADACAVKGFLPGGLMGWGPGLQSGRSGKPLEGRPGKPVESVPPTGNPRVPESPQNPVAVDEPGFHPLAAVLVFSAMMLAKKRMRGHR